MTPPATDVPDGRDFAALAFVAGPPAAVGTIRAAPEDFVVVEDLGFVPDGEGDHVFVRVRKRDANTEWVGRRLAELAGVHPRDVGYAGLKDRSAVAEQTFSLSLPGRAEPDWSALDVPGVTVLATARNRRKLRRGALAGNRFEVVVRDLATADGAPVDRAAVDARLERLAASGAPNYFGPQRFGIDGGNLRRAGWMFAGTYRERDRHRRGLYYSAVRSYLFNHVLSRRVADRTWDRALDGEALVLDGSRSFFVAETLDAEIERRVAEMDIHPSGPLWGRGEPAPRGAARAIEEAVLAPFDFWRAGLEAERLDHERRALRVAVRDLTWAWLDEAALRISFALTAGAYATTVLREVVDVTDARADSRGTAGE